MLWGIKKSLKKNKRIWISICVITLVLFVYYLPFMIAGHDSYIIMWDVLDSEIIFNKLGIKYFFDFNGTVPELLDIDVKALNYFTLFGLSFYAIFPDAFVAYMVNDFVMKIFAFWGMYLLLTKFFKSKHFFICLVVSVSYALIPFMSVYGLTVVGIPLIIWAFWNIFEKHKLVVSYLVVVFFGISSSLFLCGYYILAILIGLSIFFLCKKNHRKQRLHFYLATILLIGLYLLCNVKLIALMMSDYVSHRELWNDNPGIINTPYKGFLGFFEVFFVYFGFGQMHTRALYSIIVLTSITLLIIGLFAYKKHKRNFTSFNMWKNLSIVVGINAGIALLAAFLYSEVTGIILSFFGLNTFNLSRIYHLLATTWHFAFAFSLIIIFNYFFALKNQKLGQNIGKAFVISLVLITCIFSNGIRMPFGNENYFSTWGAAFGHQSTYAPSYKQFYDVELFTTIETYISTELSKQDGKYLNRENYKVASVGMYPSIATFNGFITIDGYSQNYSLEYWKQFNEIIWDEVKGTKNEEYWIWGNKCYLFSTELGRKYNWHKDSGMEISPNYNYEAFVRIGGDLVFSAVKIANASDKGLEILNEGNKFQHSQSWWGVYLYKASS